MAKAKNCSLCGALIERKVYFHAQPDPEEKEIAKLVPVCEKCASLCDPYKAARDLRKSGSN